MAGLAGLDRRLTVRLTLAMISEIDIWQTAVVMIKRRGDSAEFETCIRADELTEKGGCDGMRLTARHFGR